MVIFYVNLVFFYTQMPYISFPLYLSFCLGRPWSTDYSYAFRLITVNCFKMAVFIFCNSSYESMACASFSFESHHFPANFANNRKVPAPIIFLRYKTFENKHFTNNVTCRGRVLLGAAVFHYCYQCSVTRRRCHEK